MASELQSHRANAVQSSGAPILFSVERCWRSWHGDRSAWPTSSRPSPTFHRVRSSHRISPNNSNRSNNLGGSFVLPLAQLDAAADGTRDALV